LWIGTFKYRESEYVIISTQLDVLAFGFFHDFKINCQKLHTSTLNNERMKIHRPRTLV